MKDIDFDELDKAVSAVLEPSEKAAPAPVVSKTAVKEEPETPKPRHKEDDSKADIDKPKTEKSEPKEVADDGNNVAVKVNRKPAPMIRTGRPGAFMDMVHPKSRMVGGPAAKPVEAPSHTGIKLDAPSSVTDNETPEVQPVDEKAPVEPQPAKPEEPKEAAPSAEIQAETKSDPLSFHGFKYQDEQKDSETAEQQPVDDGKSVEHEQPVSQPASNPEPYSATAFVEGAKVEKRPLGAFSEAPAESNETPPHQEPAAPDETRPSEVNVHAHPREYDDDILKVEADHTESVSPAADKKDKAEEKVTDLPASPVVASIPQQYQVKSQETKDENPGPLFDTKDYHPPIAAHHEGAHKHLTIWVVIAILLLLATAAAYGYWVYIGLN